MNLWSSNSRALVDCAMGPFYGTGHLSGLARAGDGPLGVSGGCKCPRIGGGKCRPLDPGSLLRAAASLFPR